MKVPTAYELKQLRIKAGLTQEALARKAGVSQAMVARVESGDVDPRTSMLNKILAAIADAAKETKTAADVMTSPVISIPVGSMVSEAIEVMRENAISQLPIVKVGVPVGMITEEDIMAQVRREDDPSRLKRVPVEKMMRENPPIMPKGADLKSIIPLLEFSPAVFIMDRTQLIGIITKSNILNLI
ncbi:MAG: CBS domain-containing protein [archaeon]